MTTERRRLPRPPRARVLVGLSIALFAVVMALLSAQLRAGRDPALGTQVAAAAPPSAPKVVRIERRVVVTTVHHRAPAPASAPAPAASAPAPPPAASVPVASAPPPAPAPAPAPAPVVTRTS